MKRILYSLLFVLGVGIFLFLVRDIPWTEFKTVLADADWRYVVGGFVLYVFVNILRALRFRLFVPDINISKFLSIVGIQNFANTFLPFRIGELSYVYLVRESGTVGTGRNIASLVGSRFLDFLSIALIFLGALLLTDLPAVAESFRLPALFSLAFLAVMLIILIVGSESIAVLFAKKQAVLGTDRPRLKKILHTCEDGIRAIGELKSRRFLIKAFSLSLASWIGIFASGALLLMGTGVELSLSGYIFSYAFPVFISQTPLMVGGGFGSYEASLGGGLIIMGVPSALAVLVSIIVHIAELLYVILFAGGALLFSHMRTTLKKP